MQFIYILTLNAKYHDLHNWNEETNRVMTLHFSYLKRKFEEGIMKHVGRTDLNFGHEDLHGYAVFEAKNEDAASIIMNNDPAVLNGLMSAKLRPYKIVFQ
jgi:uncharacterized protein YciI